MQNPIFQTKANPINVGSPLRLGDYPNPQRMIQQQQRKAAPPAPAPVPDAPIDPTAAAPDAPAIATPAPPTAVPTMDAGSGKSVTTPYGVFDIGDEPGQYYIRDGDRKLPVDAADVPKEVTDRALSIFPAPGVKVFDGRQYKTDADGTVRTLIDGFGKWAKLDDASVESMPEGVRKMYYEAKGKSDEALGHSVAGSPMWGNNDATREQVEKKKQEILKISQDLAENQGLKGITSTEELIHERIATKNALEQAKKSGNAEQVQALTEKAQQLANTQIIQTPEGGYIMGIKDALGGDTIWHTVTPKEPKKTGEYDYTKDPMELEAAARSRAEVQNRQDLSEQSGKVIMNDSSNRIMRDFVGSYAKWYRAQQVSGNHPSGVLPEILTAKLAQQMNPATADPDGALKTLSEMQEALADVYGKGYLALRPDYSKPTTYNNGREDNRISHVPAAPDHGWDVKPQISHPPKAPAKEPKEVNLILPDYSLKNANAQDAQGSVAQNLQVDPSNTSAVLAAQESKLYKQPDAQIPNYVTPSGARPDSATRDTAFDQHTMERVKQDVGFKGRMINGLMSGIQDAANSAELDHAPKSGATRTGADGETSVSQKEGTSKETYENTMKQLFGSAYPTSENGVLYYDKKGGLHKGQNDVRGETLTPAYTKWSDPNAVKAFTEHFFSLPDDKQRALVEKSAYAKTLYMMEGVAKGRNGRLEIDSRLNDVAAAPITKALTGVLLPEAKAFYRNNKRYFDGNLIKESGGATINEEQIEQAVSQNIITRAVLKMMGATLKK